MHASSEIFCCSLNSKSRCFIRLLHRKIVVSYVFLKFFEQKLSKFLEKVKEKVKNFYTALIEIKEYS